ncbi:hypothetical protein LAZ67_10001601 [Cordylochernes scorpioides]|uniref:Uncharacterized protein n=1 Tax=Cordylochernes scorpioides TaxID=51811 RepID=A0ABY6KVY2_9ARAC|nr:hypothetical protein LAZ67_10001601 [Cordylochernes scorpioides]
MYRQILVRPTDAERHRMLWRRRSEDKLTAYRLNYVTYGTALEPSLAMRTLLKLVEDEGNRRNDLKRIVAWILCFCNNCHYSAERYQSPLTTAELRNAQRRILQAIQFQHFREEMRSLTTLGSVKCMGKICGLILFLDDQGILGVGGRLKCAPSMTYEQKYPALLPSLFFLISTQITLRKGSPDDYSSGSYAGSARRCVPDAVLLETKVCVTCCQYNHVTQNQHMSDLHKEISTPGKPFSIIGVDYEGPLNHRLSNECRVVRTAGVLRRPLVKLVQLLVTPLEFDAAHQFGEDV